MNVGIIILAGGNSSRMGSPKQLLPFKGSTLLQRAVDAATHTPYAPIVLVLGAYADEVLKQSTEFDVDVVINDSWEQGISSSISAGLSKMLQIEPGITGVIIAVSDQPFLGPEIFNALVEKCRQSKNGIVACNYAKTKGTPALFSEQYFSDLLSLQGNSGAKPVLQKYAEDVATVEFELGHIDIDTETDYSNLTNE